MSLKDNPSRETLERELRSRGHDVSDEVLIVGLRMRRDVTDLFDDTLIFSPSPATRVWTYPITTKPGLYYMKNGLAKGTAILKPGQYSGCYMLGKHQGKYDALVQSGPVTVYRDANKDDMTDYINPETGLFGINIHRSSASGCSKIVHNWSAGCQVFQCIGDYTDFLGFLRDAVARGHHNKFTYTLIDLSDG